MKRLVSILLLALLALPMAVWAETTTPGSWGTTRYEKLSITADVSTATTLSTDLIGGCLYAIEAKCTDDDVIVVTLFSGLGTTYYTFTTDTAILGDVTIVDNFFPINHPLTYTVSGYGDAAGCVVEITSWQR
jgi:hypothetical protein